MGRGVVKDRNNYWSGTQTFERIVVEDAVFLDGAAYDLSSGNVTFPNTLDSGSIQATDETGVKLKNESGTEIFRADGSGHISLFDTPISSWGSDYRAVEGPNSTWLMSALPSGNEVHFVSHAYIDDVGWKYKTSNEIPVKSSYGAGTFSISAAQAGVAGDELVWSDVFTINSEGAGINNPNPSGSLDARSFATNLGTTVASANLDASKALFLYSGHDNQAPTLFWNGDLGMVFGTGYDYTTGALPSGNPTNYLLNQQTHSISSWGWNPSYGQISGIWDESDFTFAVFNIDSATNARGFSFTPLQGNGVHGRIIRAISLVSVDPAAFFGLVGTIRSFKFYGKNGPSGSFSTNLNPTDWTLLVEGDSTSIDLTSPDVFTFTNNTVYDHYMIHFLPNDPFSARALSIYEMGMYEDAGSSFTNLMQILPDGNVNVTNTLNATTLQEGNVDLSTRYILATQRGADDGVCELVSGVVPSYRMPPLAISQTSVVADLAAKYALTTERGDIAIVTGTNQTFIKLNDDAAPTNAGDWTELIPNAVVSVNGDTGPIVSLDTSQIAEGGTNLYYSDLRVDGRISNSSINTLKDVSLSLATAPQTNPSSANKALRINGAGNGVDHTTFSLPVSNGTSGQVLTSDGNGNTAWAEPNTASTFLSLLDTPSTYSPTDLSQPSMPVTASSTRNGSPSNVIDDLGGATAFGWEPDTDAVASDEFVVIDFGSEVTIESISVEALFVSSRVAAKDFKVLGSTDGSNFTQFFPEDGSSYQQLVYNQSGPQVFDFTNNTAYRHIKVIFNGSWWYKEGIVGGNYGSYPTIDIRNLEFYQSLAGSYVKVNSTANGLVFEPASSSGSSTFTGLADTPANFTSSEGDVVTVNSTGNALEFTSVYDVIRDAQTPDITSYNTTATISSHDHNVIFSNPSQDIALTLPISLTDASLNEESRFYIKNTSASHRVIVRGLSSTDHPQVERLDSNDTTASSGSFVLHPKESAVFQGYNLSGNYRVVSHYRDDLTEIVTSSISQTKSAKTFVCTATSAATIDLLDYPFWPLNVPILFKNLSTQDLTLDPHISTQVDGSSNSIVIPFGKSVAIQRVDISTLIIADDTRVASGGSGVSDFVSLSDTPASFTGASLDLVRVNSGGTALEFVDTSALGFAPSTHLTASNPHGITASGIGAATTGALATTNTNLSNHLQDPNNPHGITAAGIGAATSNDLTTHTSNTTNPHGTTFLKLGDTPAAYSNGNAVRSTTSGFEFFNPRQDDLFVITSAPSASQTLDCNINNGNQVFYFTVSPTADVALTLANLSLAQSHATTVVVVFNQGANPYKITGLAIAGQSSLTLKWQGGTNAGTANSLDVFSFTILATATNTYTVFGNVTSFT